MDKKKLLPRAIAAIIIAKLMLLVGCKKEPIPQPQPEPTPTEDTITPINNDTVPGIPNDTVVPDVPNDTIQGDTIIPTPGDTIVPGGDTVQYSGKTVKFIYSGGGNHVPLDTIRKHLAL